MVELLPYPGMTITSTVLYVAAFMAELLPYPGMTPTIISVHDQIASLNYQYMRMMLIIAAILFIYVVFNFLFREDNEKTKRVGRAFDAGCIVLSSFILVVSIIYFTGWM